MLSDPLFRFGAFEIQLETGELRKRGRKIKLPPQSFRLLALLLSSPGQLVTREAIRKEIWGSGTFVDFEHGLNFCVRQVRHALGESARKPRFIETLPRRGYRFVVEPSNRRNVHQASENTPGAIANSANGRQAVQREQSRPAVAVLEFENHSGDENVEWLATGIAESLATDLRKLQSVRVVSSDRVRVALRQASAAEPACSNLDYGVLGRRTGADWVVTGSYQRDGNRLRVISQLYEVRAREMASASKVDGTWNGIFKLQDRVARKLIEALQLTVNASEKRRIAMQKTGYVEAYEEFSKGRRKLFGMGKGTLDEAVQHFRRALALDPQYAMAHSGLGATHAMRFIHRSEPDDLLQAREHLERALELDAELAEPYPWLCYIYMREGRLQEALDAGHRAIQLLPDFVQAHYFLALVYFVSCESNPGNYQSAANHLLQAGRVHPRWQATWFVLSFLSLLIGKYERAEEFANRLLELNSSGGAPPGFVGAEALLGTICLRRGDFEAACRWFTRSLNALYQSDHTYRDGMRTLSACGLGDAHLREGKPYLALADYRQAWQIVQEYPTMLAQDRHSVRALAGLAAAYAAVGELKRATQLLSQALQKLEKAAKPQSAAAGANLAELYYAVTVAHVRAGNSKEALDALEKAIHAGWLDAGWLERDPELRPLQCFTRLAELLQQIRQSPKIQLQL